MAPTSSNPRESGISEYTKVSGLNLFYPIPLSNRMLPNQSNQLYSIPESALTIRLLWVPESAWTKGRPLGHRGRYWAQKGGKHSSRKQDGGTSGKSGLETCFNFHFLPTSLYDEARQSMLCPIRICSGVWINTI